MNHTDKRYERTEKALSKSIRDALSQNPRTICLKPLSIIRRAKISSSTFYRHHKSLDHFLRHYNQKMYKKFSRHFHYAQKFHPSLQTNIELFLKNFSDNPDYFCFIFSRYDFEIVFKIFSLLRPQICKKYSLTIDADEEFRMLFFEVYSILEKWSKNNFCLAELTNIKDNILILFEMTHWKNKHFR